MDIDEDEEIDLAAQAQAPAAMDVDAADDGEPYVVDVFTFAKPIKYYESVLSAVCHCETAPFMVLLSRSAHPGALIAGRTNGARSHRVFWGAYS